MICRRKNIPASDRVSDHCHRTDATRAILCRTCNGFLGSIETGHLDDAAMFNLMRRKGVRAADIPSRLRRMRTYIEFWRLQVEELESFRQQFGDFGTPEADAAWMRAEARALLRYRRWLRRTYGLHTWQQACWTGLGWHVHDRARITHRAIAVGLRLTALPSLSDCPNLGDLLDRLELAQQGIPR